MSDYLRTHAHNFEYHGWKRVMEPESEFNSFPETAKVTRLPHDINKFLKTAEECEDVPSGKNGVPYFRDQTKRLLARLFISSRDLLRLLFANRRRRLLNSA